MPRTSRGIYYTARPDSRRKPYYARRYPQSRVINTSEKKFMDIQVGSSGLDSVMGTNKDVMTFYDGTNNTEAPLSLIAQGAGDSQRVGRRAWLHSFQLRLMLYLNQVTSNSVSDNYANIALVLDKEAHGGTAGTTQIYENTSSINSFRNLEYQKRFEILREKRVHLRGQWSSVGGGNSRVHQYVNLSYTFKKPLLIEYTGSTQDIADLAKANIMLVFNSNVSSPAIYISGNVESMCRLRYTDAPSMCVM